MEINPVGKKAAARGERPIERGGGRGYPLQWEYNSGGETDEIQKSLEVQSMGFQHCVQGARLAVVEGTSTSQIKYLSISPPCLIGLRKYEFRILNFSE